MPRSVIVSTGISGSVTVSRTAMMAALSSSFTAASMEGNLHPFEREGDSLADADAHGRQRELTAVPLQLLGGGEREAGTRHAERMAERDRAAVGVHLLGIVREAELTEDGKTLSGECLVQLDHVEIADLETEPPHQFLRGGRRANPHDPRGDAGDGGAEHPRLGREAVALCRFFRSDDDYGRAVVNPRCIPGGDRAVGADDRLQFSQRFEACRAWVLVLVDDQRLALALRDLDRDDLRCEAAVRLRRGRPLLTA